MGNTLSGSSDNILTPPDNYTTPSFPSLYNPAREFSPGTDQNAGDVPGVYYLYYSIGILFVCGPWS